MRKNTFKTMERLAENRLETVKKFKEEIAAVCGMNNGLASMEVPCAVTFKDDSEAVVDGVRIGEDGALMLVNGTDGASYPLDSMEEVCLPHLLRRIRRWQEDKENEYTFNDRSAATYEEITAYEDEYEEMASAEWRLYHKTQEFIVKAADKDTGIARLAGDPIYHEGKKVVLIRVRKHDGDGTLSMIDVCFNEEGTDSVPFFLADLTFDEVCLIGRAVSMWAKKHNSRRYSFMYSCSEHAEILTESVTEGEE